MFYKNGPDGDYWLHEMFRSAKQIMSRHQTKLEGYLNEIDKNTLGSLCQKLNWTESIWMK